MAKFRQAMLVGFTVFVATACTDGEAPAPDDPSEQLTIRRHDATTLDATLSSGGASLHVLISESEPEVFDVTFDFGDPVIGWRLDYRAGTGEFQPSGAPLDAAQSRLVDRLLAELDRLPTMQTAQRTRVEDVARRMTSLMQIVPAGEPLAVHEFASQQGWIHLSCTCQSQYLGSGDYRTCGRGCSCGGGNGCKGRCGTGCGPCAGSTAYTRDCGRHDWGIGSFAAASDDFSFAPNNCSCISC